MLELIMIIFVNLLPLTKNGTKHTLLHPLSFINHIQLI